MKVSELAKRNNVSADTVRYYSRVGLLAPTRNDLNGYKCYSLNDEKQLHFILQAKSLGFSLDDIKTIIHQSKKGQSPCPQVRKIMANRLDEVQQKITSMQLTYKKMQQAITQWHCQPDCIPSGYQICHLIEDFSDIEVVNDD